MAKLQIHPIGLVVIIFGLLAWVIALGGCGAAQYQCVQTNSYAQCAIEYQWEWWSLWFEFALLVALFITCFLEAAFKRGQLTLLAFLVCSTLCCMLSAHNFLTNVSLGPINLADVSEDATNAASAGFVLLGIANFALLIVLSKDFGAESHAVRPRYEPPTMLQFQSSAPV